jgi:glutamine amidotransferase
VVNTVIIDYGSGNLRSVEKSTLRAAEGLGMDVVVSGDPEDVIKADRIILPGVGAFADCMQGLNSLEGMRSALEEAVLQKGVPFLGICVGMQLLADTGLEHGHTKGLGWIGGTVEQLDVDVSLKVPHMGWNDLELTQDNHPLLEGIKTGDHAYFVHSYHFKATDHNMVLSEVDYDGVITAMVARDNIVGTQFHPEKSQKIGLRFLKNFLQWSP